MDCDAPSSARGTPGICVDLWESCLSWRYRVHSDKKIKRDFVTHNGKPVSPEMCFCYCWCFDALEPFSCHFLE
jgi:hypothetical protein